MRDLRLLSLPALALVLLAAHLLHAAIAADGLSAGCDRSLGFAGMLR